VWNFTDTGFVECHGERLKSKDEQGSLSQVFPAKAILQVGSQGNHPPGRIEHSGSVLAYPLQF